MSITEKIRQELFLNRDEKYRDFQSKLMPTVDKSTVIGVRTPVLRKMAKELAKVKGINDFLNELPHKYYEENNLHSFIISEEKDFPTAVKKLDAFLPFVDNWATCDQMRPKAFNRENERLKAELIRWMASKRLYTRRFGIEMLMTFFLDDKFLKEQNYEVAKVRGGEYYIDMMKAWYFATALAKQWDDTVFVLTDGLLDKFTHNMTIKKAAESFRITPEQKEYLKTLKK